MNPLPLLVIVLVLGVVGWAKWLDWHTARQNPEWTFGQHPKVAGDHDTTTAG